MLAWVKVVAVDSGYVLKTKSADGLNVGLYLKRRGIKDNSKVLVLLVPQTASLCLGPFPEVQKESHTNNSYLRLEVLGS